MKNSLKMLKQLQQPSGLLSAAPANSTGYHRAWIRDNIYQALGFEAAKKYADVRKIYRALLDILLKHEWKIDFAVVEKPQHKFQYIHPRYDPVTGSELHEEWGNKQNDAIGALLFKIGDLEEKGIKIIRNEDDTRLLQKLVWYLRSVEYWHDMDNGVWEENEEVHASSVGACVAGLKKISKIVDVPLHLITKGEETLNLLLPRESETKETDLALLSLIYPYNIVTREQAEAIISNIEAQLVRERGIIRYLGDAYYNKNGEAEWTFGFPWLAIIFKQLNNPEKYAEYMRKTIDALNEKGELPELYFAGSPEYNENTPLGWSQALLVVMMQG